MSTTGKTTTPLVQPAHSFAEQCTEIVRMFHQPQLPQTTNHWRRFLFHAAIEAKKQDSTLDSDDEFSMMVLWDALDRIDKANEQLCKEQ